MATITITIPDEITIESRGEEFAIKLAGLTADYAEKALVHGIGQKAGDAGASAALLACKDKFGDKVTSTAPHKDWLRTPEGSAAAKAHSAALIAKAIANIEANVWTAPRGGGAVSTETTIQRVVTRAALKAQLGGESAAWKEFIGKDKADQNAKLDEVWAKNAAALKPAFDGEVALRAQKRNQPKVATLTL